LDQWHLPYPNEYFDVIHARVSHHQFSNLKLCLIVMGILPVNAHRSEHGFHLAPQAHLAESSFQIKNYPRLLIEIARMLRPGGLVILIEPDTEPIVDGKFASQIARSGHASGMSGWVTLWREYRRCLKAKGIDLSAPSRLRKLIQATSAFGKVISQQADIPIGFWPKGLLLQLMSTLPSD
jgi:hypothetical protein